MCDVAIPNKENAYVYEKEVLNQFKQNHIATSVTQAVFTGDTEKLQMLLNRFMLESVSSFDVGNESFYHGMMLGLCAVTGNRWHIRANRESGLGRFDIMLIPEDNSLPGLIYEFKHTKDERTDLNRLAKQALQWKKLLESFLDGTYCHPFYTVCVKNLLYFPLSCWYDVK